MVSVGSISLGVSLKGVKQAIKEAEEFKQEIAGVEDETGVAAGEMDNFSDSTEQGRESTGKMTGAISRLHGWIQILLGGSLVTMITSLVSLSSISAAASVVMAKLTGAFAALVAAGKVVLGAIGTIIGVLSAKIIIILAVIAAVGLLITEITGLTNVTALNKDKVLEFAGAVKQWIINAINSIGKFGKKAFNKLVSLGSKIKNKIINIIDNTIDNIQKKITNLVDNVIGIHRVTDKNRKALGIDPADDTENILEIFKGRIYGMQDIRIKLGFNEDCKRFAQRDINDFRKSYGWEE